MDVVKRYRKILEEIDEPFPQDFPLRDIIKAHDPRGEFDQLLKPTPPSGTPAETRSGAEARPSRKQHRTKRESNTELQEEPATESATEPVANPKKDADSDTESARLGDRSGSEPDPTSE